MRLALAPVVFAPAALGQAVSTVASLTVVVRRIEEGPTCAGAWVLLPSAQPRSAEPRTTTTNVGITHIQPAIERRSRPLRQEAPL
jgi:hypothetical protein